MGCIYQIKNLVTSDIYIGSTTTMKRRQQTHLLLLRKNKHHSRYLQNAFNHYGEHSFIFEVIKDNVPDEKLVLLEQQTLDELKPVYNTMKDIKSHIGVKRSEETKRKMSEARKRQVITEETKEKIRKSLTGRKHTLETRIKRAEKGYRTVQQFDLQNNLIKEWKGPHEAAQALGIRRSGIYSMIHGGMGSYKGYIWKYKDGNTNNWKFTK